MNGNVSSDRSGASARWQLTSLNLNVRAIAIAFGLVMVMSGPAVAQMSNSPEAHHSFTARTEAGESLKCQPSSTTASIVCERSPVNSSAQPLDGASDMLIKLIYLGLPGIVLVGVSVRTLHLHRQLMRQRAFVESLERIWERTVSY